MILSEEIDLEDMEIVERPKIIKKSFSEMDIYDIKKEAENQKMKKNFDIKNSPYKIRADEKIQTPKKSP